MGQIFDLKEFRLLNNLSQKQIGKLLGVSQTFISGIEKGKKSLPEDKLAVLTNEYRGYKLPHGYVRETVELSRFNPLVALRKENDITQKQLAEYLCISIPYISQMEQDKTPLSQDKVEKIRHNDQGWCVDAFNESMERLENDRHNAPLHTISIRDVNVGSQVGGHNNTMNNSDTHELIALRERVAMLEKLLDEKERLIGVLMGRKD